jgi:hypothetical protein
VAPLFALEFVWAVIAAARHTMRWLQHAAPAGHNARSTTLESR